MSAPRAVDSAPRRPAVPAAGGAAADSELDEQARKRLAVGLAPRRPTAKEAPLRPPAVQTFPISPALLAFVLVAVLAATGFLVWANLAETRPAWWPEWGQASPAAVAIEPQALVYTLRVGDDFGAQTSALRQGGVPGEWRTELAPEQSYYRMQVWPNHLAWSLLGVDDLQRYRIQTSVIIDAATPEGYAGLMVRSQAELGFILFAVDGRGRFSVQVQTRGGTEVLQPWTPAPFLQPAPSANLLTVEDHGDHLRFFANQSLLYTLAEPQLPIGYVGLAAGAYGADVAEIRFDWFQLYDAAGSTTP